MVVILLLSPPPPTPTTAATTTTTQLPYAIITTTTNGCDGGSNDSNTSKSTTSTGDTVIPTIYTDHNKAIPLPNEATTYQHYKPPQPLEPPAQAAIAHHRRKSHHHHRTQQSQLQSLTPCECEQQPRQQPHPFDRAHTSHGGGTGENFDKSTKQQHSSHLHSIDEGRQAKRYSNANSGTHDASHTHTTRHGEPIYQDEQHEAQICGTKYPSLPTPNCSTFSSEQTFKGSVCELQDPTIRSPQASCLPKYQEAPNSSQQFYTDYWCNEERRKQQQQQQQHQSSCQHRQHLCANPLPKPPRTGAAHPSYTSSAAAVVPRRSSRRHVATKATSPKSRWSIPPLQEPANSRSCHWHQYVESMPMCTSLPYISQQQQQQSSPPDNAYYTYDYNHNNFNNNNNNNDNTNQTKATTITPSTTTDVVRHVTRVNFYDVVTSQVEFESKDDNDDDNNDVECDTEAITKEEEWITKKKTELTTTRQIETRVKRQLVLEDGKVVEDSGPIVSTNTTEDTDKQETETTEKRDLGIPIDGIAVETKNENAAIDAPDAVDGGSGGQVAVLPAEHAKIVKKMVPRPSDGLVRETNEKRVISHEEVKDYLETEDVRNLGDFSDETYVQAVNSGVENLQEVLLAAENQKQNQLVPFGPRIIANTTKSFKTIDSEDVEKRCLLQPDGKLVTESKTTTEHEVIVDRELPEEDDKSIGSREKIATVEATQHLHKQREQQRVDQIVDGKVVNSEMRYAAETMQIEKDGSLERPGDWDSLSDRMRKLRRPHQKNTLPTHKETTLLADRKDALTKRPLDFDREEETRKGETIKWLESHFGSESTASNDSREDDPLGGGGGDIEPTKKTFFNVTIKSNQTPTPPIALANGHRVMTTANNTQYEPRQSKENINNTETHTNGLSGHSKYYQGISNWSDRKEEPINHFASKAFREDLQETIARNHLRRNEVHNGTRDKLAESSSYVMGSSDAYVSREDILQQKQRQSLSSQFLAKTNRNSRDRLDDFDAPKPVVGKVSRESGTRHINGSRTDLRYGGINGTEMPKNNRSFIPAKQQSQEGDLEMGLGRSPADIGLPVSKKYEYGEMRSRSYERTLEDTKRVGSTYDLHSTNTLRPLPSETERDRDHLQTSTLGRPTVPQRRRTIEKKMRQQHSDSPPPPHNHNVPLERQHAQSQGNLLEPPPDYSPSPRSRSSSPQVDYVNGVRTQRNYRHNNADESSGYGPPSQAPGQSSTLTRKQNQRTRFAPTIPHEQRHSQTYMRPAMATQTTQTTASTISNSTAVSHKSSNKMGHAIGKSLRKLVNKIRSASAERKMRMKSRSKSREQSPSPQANDKATTYQQYNLIDSHISGQGAGGSNESELESMPHEHIQQAATHKNYSHAATLERNSGQQPTAAQFKRANSADPYAANDRDGGERGASPRQRYYLGEDPYSSTLYGKENMYGPANVGGGKRKTVATRDSLDVGYAGGRPEKNSRDAYANRRHEEDFYKQRNISASTLGRYQRSSQNIAASTPNLNHDYRTAQTLPRKLHDNHPQQQLRSQQQQQHQQQAHHAQPLHAAQSSNYQRSAQHIVTGGYSTPGHPEQRMQYNQQQQQQLPIQQQQHHSIQHHQTAPLGPAKPARTYAKALNRSKSFNVHAMNGSHDPSPIYIEKLTKNNYNNIQYNSHNTTSNLVYANQAYKSNPHIYSGPSRENSLQSGLKSPSIVNLISRSQKDLTKIDNLDNSNNEHSDGGFNDKKQAFMRGLHQQAPELYRTLHGDESYHHPYHTPSKYQNQLRHSSSLEARSPIEINKDAASTVRRDSSSRDEYIANAYTGNKLGSKTATAAADSAPTNTRRILYKDDQRRRTPAGATIISVRNMGVEK